MEFSINMIELGICSYLLFCYVMGFFFIRTEYKEKPKTDENMISAGFFWFLSPLFGIFFIPTFIIVGTFLLMGKLIISNKE